jgi:regulatory protein
MKNILKKTKLHIELSEEQIIQKLENFCAYRERCESEIKQKMYTLQVPATDYETYINYLREHNFFNEDRFANSFAYGKNAIKKWGKKRIAMELQSKNIDAQKIQQSLQHIDEGMYLLKLEDILGKKIKTIKETDNFKKKQKLIQFAMQKGYEYEIISEVLKKIIN